MMKRTLAGYIVAVASLAAYAQPATAPEFEVASVRPSKVGNNSSHFNSSDDRITATNVSLQDCIKFAYRVKDYQIIGPGWHQTERYDIAAKAAARGKDDELMRMLQTLLGERFKLQCHRQSKEFPVYALVVAKSGPKLK